MPRRRFTARLPTIGPACPGQGSFSPTPTPPQVRLLLFVLAHHAADAKAFRDLPVPLVYLFGPLLAAASYETIAASVDKLAGTPLLCLHIENEPTPGKRGPTRSFRTMPVLAAAGYREGAAVVKVQLNDMLLGYLPQLLALMPPLDQALRLAA